MLHQLATIGTLERQNPRNRRRFERVWVNDRGVAALRPANQPIEVRGVERCRAGKGASTRCRAGKPLGMTVGRMCGQLVGFVGTSPARHKTLCLRRGACVNGDGGRASQRSRLPIGGSRCSLPSPGGEGAPPTPCPPPRCHLPPPRLGALGECMISYNTYVRPLPLRTRIKHWWRRVRGSK